jgi:hydroxyacylglutathione hydrolase
MSGDQVAEGVSLLTGRPEYRINQYLIGDVLIDSGTPAAARRLLRDIEGRAIVAHAITHAHPDHYGSSKALSRRLDLPFWCPSDDADALESRRRPLLAG